MVSPCSYLFTIRVESDLKSGIHLIYYYLLSFELKLKLRITIKTMKKMTKQSTKQY